MVVVQAYRKFCGWMDKLSEYICLVMMAGSPVHPAAHPSAMCLLRPLPAVR